MEATSNYIGKARMKHGRGREKAQKYEEEGIKQKKVKRESNRWK